MLALSGAHGAKRKIILRPRIVDTYLNDIQRRLHKDVKSPNDLNIRPRFILNSYYNIIHRITLRDVLDIEMLSGKFVWKTLVSSEC